MRLESLKKLPEAWRLLRISLRPNRMLGVAMLSAAVCLIIIGFVSIDSRSAGGGFGTARYFSEIVIGLFIYLCVLWLMMAPATVFTAMSTEFTRGTWIFQQTTPQSARRLLLGKLIGAPGDVYTATAVALPFLLACYARAGMHWGNLLLLFVYLLIFSAVLAVMFLYLTTLPFGKQSAPMIAPLVLVVVLLTVSYGVSSISEARNHAVPLLGLHPIKIFAGMFGNRLAVKPISFYGNPVPAIPFTIAYYSVWFCLYFMISEGRLRRILGVPTSRVPILCAIALVNFMILGLLMNISILPKNISLRQTAMHAFYLLNFGMLYYVIFLHVAPMDNIRPWLYRTSEKGWSARDWFSDDSPLFFTILVAVLMCAGGAVLISQAGVATGPKFDSVLMIWQLASFAIIILRDTLFFQGAVLLSKKSLKVSILVYLLAFVATTALFSFKTKSFGIDLTPLTPMTADIGDKPRTVAFIIYCVVNGLIAVALGGANIYLLRRARARLRT